MEDRIIRIEEQIAFLDRHVQELDGVVRELFDEHTALKSVIARLRDDTKREIQTLREAGGEDDEAPGPP